MERELYLALREALSGGIVAEVNDGFLECRYCEANNAENDPPEDDAVRHEPDCAGAAAQATLERYEASHPAA